MAPFPEAEIMTIKRLEVALRKMDFKLLKDGAYKLHEKFHSGHKFEYPDLLKEIYLEIINNPSIPTDVKDILTPTIEDILNQTEHKNYENENRVSALTSLSYSTSNEEAESQTEATIENDIHNETQNTIQEHKINAFDAFGVAKNEQNHQNQYNIFIQKMQGNFNKNRRILIFFELRFLYSVIIQHYRE